MAALAGKSGGGEKLAKEAAQISGAAGSLLAGSVLTYRGSDPASARICRRPVLPVGNRLVRAEVDLEASQTRCHRLRRRAPEEQPLAKTSKHVFPKKHFRPT